MIDPWADVVGQAEAVRQLTAAAERPVHAYLLVGPRGAGKRAAAAAFAAAVLSRGRPEPDRDIRLALAEQHPDLVVFEPEGRTLRGTEVEFLITEGSRSPVEGARKIIVVDRFHNAEAESAAALLKTIEEPPASSLFVLLAEDVPDEHIAIASRCVRIDMPAGPVAAIEQRLVADGIEAGRAAELAAASAGSLARARLLVSDERFAARRDAWASVPSRLDGTGAAVAVLVEELRELVDDSQDTLLERQKAELEELDEREKQLGTRGSGRRTLVDRHKREVRLVRDDELRFGLAVLTGHYFFSRNVRSLYAGGAAALPFSSLSLPLAEITCTRT